MTTSVSPTSTWPLTREHRGRVRECSVSPRGAEPCPHVPSPSQRLLIGAEAALSLRANASNAGEGAFEAELRVQLPPGTHYQAARSTIPVGVEWGVMGVTGGGRGHVLSLVAVTVFGGAQWWWVLGDAQHRG